MDLENLILSDLSSERQKTSSVSYADPSCNVHMFRCE